VKLEEQTPINIPDEPKEITEEATKEKNVKTLEQVKCDTCEKEMTKRTLRYHHKCPGEVIKREEIPVKKRVKKETKQDTPKEEIKAPEKPTLTNTYHERLQRALEKRHENIQKLASQIV
jgi:predicted nucleic acid binding AN1-type Zn finger protein